MTRTITIRLMTANGTSTGTELTIPLMPNAQVLDIEGPGTTSWATIPLPNGPAPAPKPTTAPKPRRSPRKKKKFLSESEARAAVRAYLALPVGKYGKRSGVDRVAATFGIHSTTLRRAVKVAKEGKQWR